ncbi:MAG: hypothetical protein LUQ38_07815 [Methanotrichaceae archaeon]|nr:hypothetical protein [Methanotrichaceae archaeon]
MSSRRVDEKYVLGSVIPAAAEVVRLQHVIASNALDYIVAHDIRSRRGRFNFF